MKKLKNTPFFIMRASSKMKSRTVLFLKLLSFLTIFVHNVNYAASDETSFKIPTLGNHRSSLGSLDDVLTNSTNKSTTMRMPSTLGFKKRNTNPNKSGGTMIRRTRAVGGENAIPNEFPFLVYFLKSGGVHCGGSILDKNFILTTALCLDDYDAEELESWTIVAGDHNWKIDEGTEQRRQIRDMFIHAKYLKLPFADLNDIAIVKLDRPLELSAAVQPIPLPEPDYEAYGNAVVAGWGKVRYGGSNPLVLQKVTVPIVDRADCEGAYANLKVYIPEDDICAGDIVKGGVDACQGDSGGPLSVKLSNGSFMLVGVVSNGFECGSAEYPGIYMQVSKFRDWIDETLTNFDFKTDNCWRRTPCRNGGTCVDGINSYSCICEKGYEGSDCASVTNNCALNNSCLNGGTCVNEINSISCACTDEFAGAFCEHGNVCTYPDTCAPPTNTGKCHRCRDGFVKDPEDDVRCRYATLNASLIISSREGIEVIYLDGQDTNETTKRRDFPLGTDYNLRSNTIFWFSNTHEKVYTAPLNAESKQQSVLHDSSSDILGLAVDWIHNHLYWVGDGRNLCVSNFNSTMKKVLIKDGLVSPHGIAVNPLNGWMYWADEGKNHIETAGLDGSQRKVILSTNIKEPQSIAVDFGSNRLYWSQGWYSSSIWSSNFDGSDQKLILTANPSQFRTSYFFKIVTFEYYVYFIEYYSKTIYKVNKCNGRELGIVYKYDSRLWDLKIQDANVQPKGENLCSKRIGHCSHFCFPVPVQSPSDATALKTTCACPDGLSLSADRQNCV